MFIKTRLASLEKRIKELPCRAHHVVRTQELENKKYDDGDPWEECTCGEPIIIFDLDKIIGAEVQYKPSVLQNHEMPNN